MDTKNWQANHPSDTLQDGITFENIIEILQCNERKPHTAATVRKCYKELLQTILQDAEYVLEQNIEYIIKQAK